MNILSHNFKLFGRYLVCQIFCLFIVFSFVAGFALLGSEPVGYNAYVMDGEEVVEEYTHRYTDGEDTKKAEYEKEGLTVKTQGITDGITGAQLAIAMTVSQIFCFVFMYAFLPYKVYIMGKEDSSRVNRGAMERDNLFGLKSTLLISLFSLATYVVLILGKLGFIEGGLQIYRYLNFYLYGYTYLIFGGAATASELGVASLILAVLPVFLVAAASLIAYIVGLKNINFYDKIVLKKDGK